MGRFAKGISISIFTASVFLLVAPHLVKGAPTEAEALQNTISQLRKIILEFSDPPNLIIDSAGGIWAGVQKWVVLGIRKSHLEEYNNLYIAARGYKNQALQELGIAERFLAEGNLAVAREHVERSASYQRLWHLYDSAAIEVWGGNVGKAQEIEYEIGKLAGSIPGLAGKVLAPNPVTASLMEAQSMLINYALDAEFKGMSTANRNAIKDDIVGMVAGAISKDLGTNVAVTKFALGLADVRRLIGAGVSAPEDIAMLIEMELTGNSPAKNALQPQPSNPAGQEKVHVSQSLNPLPPPQKTAPQATNAPITSEKIVRIIANNVQFLTANSLGKAPLGGMIGTAEDRLSDDTKWEDIEGGYLNRGDIFEYISEKSVRGNPNEWPQATRAVEVELPSGKKGWVVTDWFYKGETIAMAEVLSKSDLSKQIPPSSSFTDIKGRWSGEWKGQSGAFEIEIIDQSDRVFTGKGNDIIIGQMQSFTIGGAIFKDKIFFDKYYPNDNFVKYEGTFSGNAAGGSWKSSGYTSGDWSMIK